MPPPSRTSAPAPCWIHGGAARREARVPVRARRGRGLSKALARQSHPPMRVHPRAFHHMIDPEPVDVSSPRRSAISPTRALLETMRDARRFLRSGGTLRSVRQFSPDQRPRAPRARSGARSAAGSTSSGRAHEPGNLYVRFRRRCHPAGAVLRRCRSARRQRSRREARAEWRCERAETVHGFALWWECELVPASCCH